jgi:hypothetical protein
LRNCAELCVCVCVCECERERESLGLCRGARARERGRKRTGGGEASEPVSWTDGVQGVLFLVREPAWDVQEAVEIRDLVNASFGSGEN